MWFVRLPHPKSVYRSLRALWQPRYRVEEMIYFPEQPSELHTVRIWGDGSGPIEKIATDAIPNAAMVPVNLTARLRVWWWKRSLRRALPKQKALRAAADADGGYFQSFNEAEMRPIDNFIAEPREYREIGAAARGWYANPPSPPVVSIADRAASSARNPPVKSPWLEPKKD